MVEVEQVLVLTNQTMITLSCLLNEVDVLIKFLFRWESYSVDSLQTVIGSLSKPVSRGILHDFESLYSASVGHMRSSTQVNQVSVSVSSDLSSVRDLALNQLNLEWVVGE